MGDNSKIQWTNASWNPLVGCSRVSEGCRHCYAEGMAARIANAAQAALRAGKVLTDVQAAYRRVVRWERGGMDAADVDDKALPKWNNRVELIPSMLTLPLGWTKPRRVFVDSMSDLFHEDAPFDFIDKVFAVMAMCPSHTFQVLTKRPDRMAGYLALRSKEVEECRAEGWCLVVCPNCGNHDDYNSEGNPPCSMECEERGKHKMARFDPWPLPNVWLGTSTEDQQAADERIPHLLRCPAAVRFLSVEPQIGPVDLSPWISCDDVEHLNPCGCGDGECSTCWRSPATYNRGIHWVISGFESGHGARHGDVAWAESLVKQCQAADVACFVKQLGAFPIMAHARWLGLRPPPLLSSRNAHKVPEGFLPLALTDSHGGDWDEWPEALAHLKVREFPEVTP